MVFRLDTLPDAAKTYDVCLMFTDDGAYRLLCGKHDECAAYTIRINRKRHKDWKFAVGDFAGYYEANGKNAALVMSADALRSANEAYAGHTYNEAFLRAYEPSVLIHSTPMDNWQKIEHAGCLKSWNRLEAENALSEPIPIGSALGDPADFRDYIMFGGGTSGELVVLSKQQGKIVTDENAAYVSGARLYFDAKKMARDGLLVRDGCHLKVKDQLSLSPYMLWAATWQNIGLARQVSTPEIFAKQADLHFRKRFPSQK